MSDELMQEYERRRHNAMAADDMIETGKVIRKLEKERDSLRLVCQLAIDWLEEGSHKTDPEWYFEQRTARLIAQLEAALATEDEVAT